MPCGKADSFKKIRSVLPGKNGMGASCREGAVRVRARICSAQDIIQIRYGIMKKGDEKRRENSVSFPTVRAPDTMDREHDGFRIQNDGTPHRPMSVQTGAALRAAGAGREPFQKQDVNKELDGGCRKIENIGMKIPGPDKRFKNFLKKIGGLDVGAIERFRSEC